MPFLEISSSAVLYASAAAVSYQVLKLILMDTIIVAIFIAALIPLTKLKPATFAVLKRNFVGYFSNPTGYVFICVFVFLTSVAAFWSQEFFNSNLANLDQLNYWFPFIMLVFIPAITMSIWADERRQGTDELLLTIPASDVDIVLGKYLSAAAIFSAALLFSQITIFYVLSSLALGAVDLGLFASTYLGYWLVGLAMLSLGMAASFLTSNLTVSFIFSALFNAPLVCLALADRFIAGRGVSQDLAWWSYSSRFADFGSGVISLANIVFFVLVIGFGVYLSLLLIGRRHWLGGRDGQSLLGHYLVRAIALVGIVFAGSRFFSQHDYLRADVTTEKVSSLSPDTRRLLSNLENKYPIVIEAFVSRTVPEQYVKTKVDLLNKLREFQAVSNKGFQVRIYDDLESFSEEATTAQEKYGIEAQNVMTRSRGSIQQEGLFLGAAFSCGLERVVVPFFDRGIPVEYELVRSITTVAQVDRKKIGVVRTDAQLFGGFDMQRMAPRRKELIVEELEKQYEVEEVDLTSSVAEGSFDVLLVVQPSSLTPPQLDNLVAAIRNGQPAALFEDPFPAVLSAAPPTSQPKRPPGGGMMGGMMGGGGRQPEPKGDIRKLWELLGIEMIGRPGMGEYYDADIVWQHFNPYANKVRVQQITPEWVFVDTDAPGTDGEAFNKEDVVSSGLKQVLFLFPGAIKNIGTKDLVFTPLTRTGSESGTIEFNSLRSNQGNPGALKFSRNITRKRYVTGARIKGILRDDLTMSDAGSPLRVAWNDAQQEVGNDVVPEISTEDVEGDGSAIDVSSLADVAEEGDDEDRNTEIHVVYVSDIDLLSSDFLAIRAQPDADIKWQFDNVTFVLNILDSLTGDTELVGIRKRQTRHSTLKLVEEKTEDARVRVQNEVAEFEEKTQAAIEEAREQSRQRNNELRDKVEELRDKAKDEGISSSQELQAMLVKLQIQEQIEQRKLDTGIEALRRDRDRDLEETEHELDMEIRRVQSHYKLRAALLPPIPPLLVGMVVWRRRQKREREGVSKNRLV